MLRMELEDRALIVGVTGSGKTYFVREQVFDSHARVVAWDPKGDFLRSATHVVNVGGYAALAQLFRPSNSRYRVVVRPTPHLDDKEAAAELKLFVQLCEAMLHETTIIHEEIGLWEVNKRAQAHVNTLSTQSRHWDCPFVMVSQRAVQVPPIARTQANIAIAFRQKSDLDIRAMRLYFKKTAHKIEALPRYKFMHWKEEDDFND